jgi:diguanylate cyclase (GGDEF)-like protein
MSKSIKHKSLLLFVFFFVLVSLFSYIALYNIKRDSLEQAGETLKAILQTVEEAHHIWIDERKNSVIDLASRTDIRFLTEQLIDLHERRQPIVGSEPLEKVRQVISPYLAAHQDRGFFIIASDRISIASTRDSNIGTTNLIQTNRSKLIKRSFEGETTFIPPMYSDVQLDASNRTGTDAKSTPTLFITTPIRKPDGTVIAVLAIRLDFSKAFSNITQLGRIGNSGETYAFDEKAKLITHSRFDYQLTRTNLIAPLEQGILNIKISDPGGNLLKGYRLTTPLETLPLTLMAKSAIAGNSDINTDGYRDYRGVMVFGAWSWLKNLNYGLASEIDKEEALKPYYKTRNSVIFLVALICVLGIVMRVIIERLQQKTSKELQFAHATLEQRVLERTADLENTQTRLSEVNVELQRLAIFDGLTNLHNRRHFDSCLQEEWQRCLRHQNKIAIILFDIDYFKQYNDNYGHLAGDQVLTNIGKLINLLGLDRRPGDCVARYGGEEFVILLSNSTTEYAIKTAEQVRQGISDLRIGHQHSEVHNIDWVTVSIGLAIEVPGKYSPRDKILGMADEALYAAKARGRNNIFSYQAGCVEDANILPMKSK